jgi:hypothetical protein
VWRTLKGLEKTTERMGNIFPVIGRGCFESQSRKGKTILGNKLPIFKMGN